MRRGGNCANTLEVLQQLLLLGEKQHDVAPYLITALPSRDSPGAAKVRESFGSRSIVDLTKCVYHEGYAEPASSYIIRSEATDSRTLVSYNDLPDVTVDDFKSAASGLLRSGGKTWWHFEVSLFCFVPSCIMSSIKNCLHQQGRLPETTLECIRYLRQSDAEARISVEVEKPGRQGLQELAAEADVVFYSKSWAEVCCEYSTLSGQVIKKS